MSRKLVVICLTIFAILVSSCAPQSTPTTSQPAASQATQAPAVQPAEKAELELWWHTDATPCMRQVIDSKVNSVAKDFHMTVVETPDQDGATKSALSTGGGPDIVVSAGPSSSRQYSLSGLDIPLDQYADKYVWNKLFHPWVLSLGQVDGKLHYLGAEVETMILFYNKTLFEQKGYQVPKTFDEMVVLGEKMRKDGIIPFGSDVDATNSQHWQVDYFYAEYLNAIAGPQATYEALTGKRSWTDPVFAETFTTMANQVKDGWFMGGVDKYFSQNWDQAWAAIAKGEAAMTIQGTWMFQGIDTYFKDTGNDWGWAPIPRKDGKPVYAIGLGSAWGINKNSKHPDQAAEFLNMFFQPEVQAELMKNMSQGCIAAGPVKISEDLMAGLDPREIEVYTAMNEALASGNYSYTTWTFWPPKLQVFMQSGLEKIFNDQMKVEDFLKEADTITQEALKEGGAPPIPVR